MAFLFKSKKGGPGAASPAGPPASRKLTSRDGLPNGLDTAPKFGSTEKATLLEEEIEEEDEDQMRSRARQPFAGAPPAQIAPSPVPDGRNYAHRGNDMVMKVGHTLCTVTSSQRSIT